MRLSTSTREDKKQCHSDDRKGGRISYQASLLSFWTQRREESHIQWNPHGAMSFWKALLWRISRQVRVSPPLRVGRRRFLVGLTPHSEWQRAAALENACHSDDRKGGRISCLTIQPLWSNVILRCEVPKNLLLNVYFSWYSSLTLRNDKHLGV